MIIYEIILIGVLAVLSLLTLHHTLHLCATARRRDLLSEDILGCCESLGWVGCSVICSGVRELQHIKELLSQRYDHYEVVIVLDGEVYGVQMRSIIEHYHMVKVNCPQCEELPSATIRQLYRSRQRSYRRLIVVDRAAISPYHDLDAATAVASYNYLLPIGPRTHLCHKAIEMVAIELSHPHATRTEMFYSPFTDSYIFHRNAIIEQGGFSPRIIGQIPSSLRMEGFIPITYRQLQHPPYTLLTIIVVAFTAIAFVVAGASGAIAVASTSTLILLCSHLTARVIDPRSCSIEVILCCFRKICLFFRLRNFSI